MHVLFLSKQFSHHLITATITTPSHICGPKCNFSRFAYRRVAKAKGTRYQASLILNSKKWNVKISAWIIFAIKLLLFSSTDLWIVTVFSSEFDTLLFLRIGQVSALLSLLSCLLYLHLSFPYKSHVDVTLRIYCRMKLLTFSSFRCETTTPHMQGLEIFSCLVFLKHTHSTGYIKMKFSMMSKQINFFH